MPAQIVCFTCGNKGHKAANCVKVNLVQVPTLFGQQISPPVLKQGKIGNKEVTLFMDSGADISVIARDLLPEAYEQCMPVIAKGFRSNSNCKLCQTAVFQAEIEGKPIKLLAAVVPREETPHPAIIGRNVPGIGWSVTIKTTTDTQTDKKEERGQEAGGAGEGASQVVQESAVFPAPVPQMSSQLQQQTSKQQPVFAQQQQPKPAQQSKIDEVNKLDLENLSQVEIQIVQTRAKKKRQQQIEAANAAATAASGANPTPWESVPEETDPVVTSIVEDTSHTGEVVDRSAGSPVQEPQQSDDSQATTDRKSVV